MREEHTIRIGDRSVRSVMFDLDGTLVDSVPAYFLLMEKILENVGLPIVPKSVVAEFMTDGLSVLGKMIPEDMKDRQDELIRECIAVGRKLSQNMFRDQVELFAGVKELFACLSEREIPIGIVSSTETHYIERKLAPLARNGLRDAVDVVIGIGDVPERKPDPEPLLECARRLAVPSENCMYVGDSRVDIQAGKAAGMVTVGVLTGLDDYDALKREEPEVIIESIKDLTELI